MQHFDYVRLCVSNSLWILKAAPEEHLFIYFFFFFFFSFWVAFLRKSPGSSFYIIFLYYSSFISAQKTCHWTCWLLRICICIFICSSSVPLQLHLQGWNQSAVGTFILKCTCAYILWSPTYLCLLNWLIMTASEMISLANVSRALVVTVNAEP